MGGLPGSPEMSSCSDGEPPQSPIEGYRSRSPILSSSMGGHTGTTQGDVDSLRLLLQEVYLPFIRIIIIVIHVCVNIIRSSVCFIVFVH